MSDEHFTLSNLNLSEASWPIVIKFYVWHHWGGEKAAYGFGTDWEKTTFDLRTFDSGERSLPFGLLVNIILNVAIFLLTSSNIIFC